MNNEAFRNIVTQRAKQKTTKEIAREAVELEFREKNQKRRHGEDADYSSDDLDEKKDRGNRDGEGDNKDTYWKQGRRIKKSKKVEDDDGDACKYRDRAKERREGKNLDYESAATGDRPKENEPTLNYNVEMTKFLGGDEAHTHLVKGLDKTLAEKVRREEMGGIIKAQTRSNSENEVHQTNENHLNPVMEETVDKSENNTGALSSTMPLGLLLQRISSKLKKTSHDARSDHVNPNCSNSRLLKILTHVERMHEHKKSTEGDVGVRMTKRPIESAKVINTSVDVSTTFLRSTLSFSVKADPRDRINAWELPKETILSSTQYERVHGDKNHSEVNQNDPCTPIKTDLLSRIKSLFAMKVKESNATSQKHRLKNRHGNRNKSKMTKVPLDSDKDYDIGEGSKQCTASSDDDIFGDIGEYIPPSTSVK